MSGGTRNEKRGLLSFRVRGDAKEVGERLSDAVTITTFSKGPKPILTGRIDFPMVELYRSRAPLRGIRSHTYFQGEFKQEGDHAVLEGRVVGSSFQRGYFGFIVGSWAAIALLGLLVGLFSGRLVGVLVGLGFGVVTGLAAYGLFKMGKTGVAAERDLLLQDIETAVNDESP
jgi:hypothetical protein